MADCFRRGCGVVSVAVAVALALGAGQACAADVGSLVKGFETATDKRAAAVAIFQNYDEYRHMVADGKVPAKVARAVDEHLVDMTKEAWRDVSVRHGSGLSHVVPVGTLGDRHKNPAYIPGKSDKDFIPQGPRASQAANDFTETFQRKFGIAPGKVDVNALDPTNIKGWPDRVSAASNFEKYNTGGGTKWLDQQLHKQKPSLWRFDSLTDEVAEVPYGKIVHGAPPPLTKADAAGFFSDNMKFRGHIGDDFPGDPRTAVFKQSKYDLRNVEAFELAGGKLTQAERKLLETTQLMRNGKVDAGVLTYMKASGVTDYNKAVRAYQEAIEGLTEKMAKKIVGNHIALLKSGKGGARLANELAAAIANLPPKYADTVRDAVQKGLGKAEWNEINKVATAFKNRVGALRFGREFFDDQAVKHFGKAYDKLSSSERALLHGAIDQAETFTGKALKVTGVTAGVLFAGYTIYEAYVEGSKRGTGVAVGSAFGRATIELMQLGYPPLAAVELVGRLAAGAVELGAAAYKSDVLETLYKRYQKGETLDDLLNTQAVTGYFAGGLRQMVIEMRKDNPGLTNAQIDQRIRDYFVRRRENEKIAEKQLNHIALFEAWLHKKEINLGPGGFIGARADNAKLLKENPEEYYRRLATVMENYNKLAARLKADGIPANRATIFGLLYSLYRGDAEQFEKALADLYRTYGKSPRRKLAKVGRRLRVVSSRRATLRRAAGQQPPPALKPGFALASVSGSWKQQPNYSPAKVVGPIDVPCGGKLRAEITGSPPVPAKWSLGNHNTGLIVSFRPRYGKGFGPGSNIVRLSGQTKDNKLSGEGTWPCAGQITVVCTPSGGSGPLSGCQFAQGYSGKVVVTEVTPDPRPLVGMELADGDHLTMDTFGDVLLTDDHSFVHATKGADLKLHLNSDKPNTPHRFDLAAGKVRIIDAAGWRGPDLQLTLNGPVDPKTKKKLPGPVYSVTPTGTDFECLNYGHKAFVSAYEGSVTLKYPDGKEIELTDGQSVELPNGKPRGFDAKRETDCPVNGVPVADIPVDDNVPEPYGTIGGPFAGGKPNKGWIWQDPKDDCTLESPEPDAVKITVPNGNNLWQHQTEAPRLIHKVTGDFDFESDIRLECKGSHYAIFDFLLYAPGSYAGFLAKQQLGDGLTAHYRLLGGWARFENRNKLGVLNRKAQDCPDAPDGPVRFRLTRRGDMWKGYWSLDGQRWTLFLRETIDVPDTLWIGYGFKRMALDRLPNEPAIFTLRNVRITTAERDTMPTTAWDFAQAEGTTDASGKTVRLTLDGKKLGATHAITGFTVQGDIDIAVSFRANGWAAQKGQSAIVSIQAATSDDKTRAYVARLQTPRASSRYATDICINNRWGYGYQWVKSADTQGALRLVRKGDTWTTYYADKGKWVQLDKKFKGGFRDPVYIQALIANSADTKTPMALSADFAFAKLPAPPAPKRPTPSATTTIAPAQPAATPQPGQQPEPAATPAWTARWQTDSGEVTLTQQGNKVTGGYPLSRGVRADGRIEGVVVGDKLVGRWAQLPTYQPPYAGNFSWTMSADRSAFTGTVSWQDGAATRRATWNGRRASASQP